MLRTVLALSLCAGLSAYASDAVACSPSPSLIIAPTGVLTDTSRPIARDAGFYFTGELRQTFGIENDFEIVVTDNASGGVVEGAGQFLRPEIGGANLLAWIPLQPLAANATYTIKVNPVPFTDPIKAPQMPLPPVQRMQAVFTTTADLLPALEIASMPRVVLRTETRLPFRCQGPCGPMSGPCVPTSVLMADVEIPAIEGGAAEHGYEVDVNVRYGKTSKEDYYERTYPTLVDARAPQRVSVEAMETPEPVEICVTLQAHDISRHTASSSAVCVDAQTVAAALRGARMAPATQPAQSGAAGSASAVMAQADAPARDVASTRHVTSCAVATPGRRQAAGRFSSILLAIALLPLMRRRRHSRGGSCDPNTKAFAPHQMR